MVEPGHAVFGTQVMHIVKHQLVALLTLVTAVIHRPEVIDLVADVMDIAIFDQVVITLDEDSRRRRIENFTIRHPIARTCQLDCRTV